MNLTRPAVLTTALLGCLAATDIGTTLRPTDLEATRASRSGYEVDELVGMSGDALFERLGVPTSLETGNAHSSAWGFGDGELVVTLVADCVVQVRGTLADDFEPRSAPESGPVLGARIEQTVRRLGAAEEVLLGSNSVLLRFAGDTEITVVGRAARTAF